MNLVGSSNFSFNYTAYDQSPSLFVAFSIYDVSTGSANFLTKVVATYSATGAYMADYLGVSGKTYLVIGIVYTSNTYSTPDASRSPSAETFQVFGGVVTFLGVAYAAYDQSAILNVQGAVYDMTTGSPVLIQTIAMTEVAFGVYFGSFTGTIGETYQITQVVYTDNTFVTPNYLYAPGCDAFDCITGSAISVLGSANLVGQQLAAILIGDV